jgi:hypothetical protein
VIKVEFILIKEGQVLASHTLSEAEPGPFDWKPGDSDLPALKIEIENGLALCDGQQLFADKDTVVCEHFSMRVKVHMYKLPKREPHPDGYLCRDCLLWNREKGVEILEEETHRFAEGQVGKMNMEIVTAMSETFERPMLTIKNVGYCPKNKELCGDTAPACTEGFEANR